MGESEARPLRVMHVIARMNVGGPAIEIVELLRRVDGDHITQCILTGYCAADEADYLLTQAPEVPVHRIAGLGRRVSFFDDLLVLGKTVLFIRAWKPDIVHTHTAKAGVIGRIAARISGRKTGIVHTYHGHLLHGYFSSRITRLYVLIERVLALLTTTLIAVGDQVRDDLVQAGIGTQQKYSVIRSGVSLRPFPDKAFARQSLDLNQEALVISMIGRLTRIKRPDRFVEIVSRVQGSTPPPIFLVAGWGDQAQELNSRVEEEHLPVRILGWRDDIEVLLAASDIVMLTSDNEGAPLSLIQAGYAGLPVISTNVGSVSEVVVDGETGVLVSCDAVEFSDRLQQLIASKDLRKKYGANAHERMQRMYSTDSFVRDHVHLYDRVSKA